VIYRDVAADPPHTQETGGALGTIAAQPERKRDRRALLDPRLLWDYARGAGRNM